MDYSQDFDKTVQCGCLEMAYDNLMTKHGESPINPPPLAQTIQFATTMKWDVPESFWEYLDQKY